MTDTTKTQAKSNGVIRIGRKGVKKFAFGEEGTPFEVVITEVMQQWFTLDSDFRDEHGNEDRTLPEGMVLQYHQMALNFVQDVSKQPDLTAAEALDFLARLREQWNELADFFHVKSREELASPDSSEVELRFSPEEGSPTSTN